MFTHSCTFCKGPASGAVNDVWACTSHLEDGIRFAIQVEAMEKGIELERAERMVVEIIRELGE